MTRRRLLEVVEGRTRAVLQAALERLPVPEAIAVVSMDMAGEFRASVRLSVGLRGFTKETF